MPGYFPISGQDYDPTAARALEGRFWLIVWPPGAMRWSLTDNGSVHPVNLPSTFAQVFLLMISFPSVVPT